MELIWESKEQLRRNGEAGFAKRSEACLELKEVHGSKAVSSSDFSQANCLIKGDSKIALEVLLGTFRESVDVIYIDPPFDIGGELKQDFKLAPENGGPTSISIPAYRDSWGSGRFSYVQIMYERLQLCEQLLRVGGAIFVHCDYRTTAIFRLLLDEIFGADQHVNELIWFYKTGGVPEKLGFGKKHDTIHYYVKSKDGATWNPQKEKSYLQHRYGFSNIEIHQDERGPYCMVNCRDVFDIPALRGNQPERVDYPTQKPELLLERLITATSNEGDLILDCFCGSGTTAVVAQKLKRKWIAIDAGDIAVDCTKRRLLDLYSDLPDSNIVQSFEVRSVEKAQREQACSELCPEGSLSHYFERVSKVYEVDYFDSASGGDYRWGRFGDYLACVCSPLEIVGSKYCMTCMQGHLFGDKEDVVFFVWQGTLDLNQSLDAIKDSRLASLAAVRVESDIVNPSFSSKGVVTTEPVLDVRILNRDKDKIIVELTDYRFRLLAGPPAVRKAFGQPSTLAFLSYWGLSRASMHRTEFIPEWHSYRTRSKPTVEIHSSELDISNPTTKVLRVVAADIFGNRIEQLIKL